MRIATVAALCAVLLAGCAVPSVRLEPVITVHDPESFEVEYSGEVGPASVSLAELAPKYEPAEGTSSLGVKVEAHFIEMSSKMARELTGLSGLGPAVLSVQTAGLRSLVKSLKHTPGATLLSAPSITCHSEQAANVTLVNELAYISSLSILTSGGALVVDPIIDTVSEGLIFAVRPVVSKDRKQITLELNLVVVETMRPIETVKAKVFGSEFKIQTPMVFIQRLNTKAAIPDGGTVVLVGLGSSGTNKVTLVFVTARVIELEKTTEPKDG